MCTYHNDQEEHESKKEGTEEHSGDVWDLSTEWPRETSNQPNVTDKKKLLTAT